MTFQQITLINRNERLQSVNSALGVAAMILSPMLYLALNFYQSSNETSNPNQIYATLCGISYLAGAMMSATAMRNLRVTGFGNWARVLYFVQMTGLFLAMCFDVLEYAAPFLRDRWFYFVTDMAYPFSHLLMIIVGAAIVRAKVWRGWRKIPAFLVGFALPAFFVSSAIFGFEHASFVFPSLVTIGFFMLGLAIVLTEERI